MTVIPFDPGRRRAQRTTEQPCRAVAEGTTVGDLRIQNSLLQRALVHILRENAQNWARAEAAETRLAAIERQDMR